MGVSGRRGDRHGVARTLELALGNDEEPRITSKSRRLAASKDRTGTAHAETRPASATATTPTTSASQTTVMILALLLLRADQVIE
jgi:hypothetical protein